MQKGRYQLQDLRIGALPILNHFIERLGLEEELTLAVRNAGYADVLLALIRNILVDRNALYAIREWAALFDAGLICQGKINDDKLARALDRLFAADRATLQTRIVLAAIKGFDLKTQQIHNDMPQSVTIRFTITADGSVDDVEVAQPSGVYLLDTAAQRAVITAAPFSPLPKTYETNRLTIQAVFKPTS